MKIVKKAVAILLVIAMLMSLLVTTAFAASNVTVEVDKANANVDDTVVVTVKNNAMTVSSFTAYIRFNTAQLECTSIKGVKGGTENNNAYLYDTAEDDTIKCTALTTVTEANSSGVVSAVFAGTDNANYAAGTVFKATFKVKAAGSINISLYEDSDGADGNPAGKDEVSCGSVSVTVAAPPVPVDGISLDKTTLNLNLKNNTTAKLNATVTPDNADNKTVTWTSSNAAIAAVDNSGNVTAKAVGTATITAKAGDQTATCTVTVVDCDHSYTKEDTTKEGACKTPGTCMTEAVYYYSCEHCGMVEKNDSHTFKGEKDLNNHSYTVKDTTKDGALMTAGTCTTEAVYYYSCACGAVEKNAAHTFTDAKDLTNHSYTAQTQKAEAVKTPGDCTTKTVYYYSCSRCGMVEKDAAHTFEGAVDNTKHDYTKQTGSEATCYKLGTCTAEAEYYYSCSRCDKVETDVNHTFKGDKDSNNHAGSTKKIQYDANQHWWICEDCKSPTGAKADHSSTGSNVVTCTKLAKCDVCSQTYGALVPHSVNKVEAKEPTCTEAGNREHWTCGSCHKLFSDAAGNTETTAAAVTIKALGHKMTKTEAKAATCTEAGNNEYYTCSRCSKVFKDEAGSTETTVDAEKINALGHKMTKTEAKAATCTEDGNNAYYTCSNCNEVFKDEAGTEPTSVAAETLTPTGHGDMIHHEKVDATCQKTGVKEHYECGRCHSLFMDAAAATAASDLVLEKIPHDYKGIYNETHHWTFCAACGATTAKAAHDFTVDETTGTKTCDCGYVVYGEGSASCDQHETKLVFDETHHWHVCEHCSYAEDKVAHDFGEWETDVEATATTDGLRHRTCKECSYVQQEVIAKPSTTPDRPNHRPSGGSATSSDKVQSSKTFDAGIAAYVGLSVLSLTGSALVIGKKKEF